MPLNYIRQQTSLNLTYSNNLDKVYINYATNEVFVSKGCGYKMNYVLDNIIIENDNENWINFLEIINHNIAEESNYHVKIFF